MIFIARIKEVFFSVWGFLNFNNISTRNVSKTPEEKNHPITMVNDIIRDIMNY
jgi:hypothetical protein